MGDGNIQKLRYSHTVYNRFLARNDLPVRITDMVFHARMTGEKDFDIIEALFTQRLAVRDKLAAGGENISSIQEQLDQHGVCVREVRGKSTSCF
jgi:hypothetical protein